MNGEDVMNDFPRKVGRGSVLRCAGRVRAPHDLVVRIEEIGDNVTVVATILETGQREYFALAKGQGSGYFFMYRGEAFAKVEILPQPKEGGYRGTNESA